MNLEYKNKYLKYKAKYNKLKKQFGGTNIITSAPFNRFPLTNIKEEDFKPLECAEDNNIILKNKEKILNISNKIKQLQKLLYNFGDTIKDKINNESEFNDKLYLIKDRMKLCNELIDKICILIDNFTILCVDCKKNNELKSFLIVNLKQLKLIQDKLIEAYKNTIIELIDIDPSCCKKYNLASIFKFDEVNGLENIRAHQCLDKKKINLLKEKNQKHKELFNLI
jgi:hypothetical protein